MLDLRSDTLPPLEDTGAQYYLTGSTAFNVDAAEQIQSRMPLLFVAVIGLSFILLTAVFRSVTIALKAAVMNLLSIAAAYGVVVAIFQFGWGGELIGVDKGPIEVFRDDAVHNLFGLDGLQVFLIVAFARSACAASFGMRRQQPQPAANVITAAAAMVTVFLAFVLGPDVP